MVAILTRLLGGIVFFSKIDLAFQIFLQNLIEKHLLSLTKGDAFLLKERLNIY